MAAVRAIAWALAVLSTVGVGFVGFLTVASKLQHDRTQDLLYDDFRTQLAAATAPIGDEPIAPGSPMAVLDLPALDLREVVVEGTAGRDLRAGPGHVRTTILPGQVGISTLHGRSTTYGGPFGRIGELAVGSAFSVVTGQGRFRYEVESVRRDGDPLPAPLEAGGSRLVLVSTDGPQLRADSTLYVDARLVSPAAPTPAARPVVLPPYEYPLASDPVAVLSLALWLLAALGWALGAVWGVLRWGRLQTWAVAFPVGLAVAWGVFDSAALLLPNLL